MVKAKKPSKSKRTAKAQASPRAKANYASKKLGTGAASKGAKAIRDRNKRMKAALKKT